MKEKFGSWEKFNRILYGGHGSDDRRERFFTFAGDLPIFMGAASDHSRNTWCHQAKNGTLISGLALTEGYSEMGSHDLYSGFFHDCSDCVSAWRHGFMTYELSRFSPNFPLTRVRMEVYPLQKTDGFLVHYEIESLSQVIFCAGFGGITPYGGRYEYHTSPGRDFSAADCEDNHAELIGVGAEISGPEGVTMLVGANFDCDWCCDAPEAMQETYPAQFLVPHPGEKRVVKLRRTLAPGERFSGDLAVIRNGTEAELADILADGDITTTLRRELRAKYAAVACVMPDATLTDSVPDTVIALDAAFHGRTFYHGAVGYHAPFLGWRGWYAATLLGWRDRVAGAILNHFATITRSPGPEKVWWDGADRPDLDHEGTQYHHISGTSGRLTALLDRDDIYDMQEVALDMTIHCLRRFGDRNLATEIFDRMAEVLDWEERVLDPDDDGLYQNFLNTWISDGHSYNGGGCAQASAYICAANLGMAELAETLGRDAEKFRARAGKIRNALQTRLWLEEEGILAEYVDTIGRKLLHPAPELSTIYLASECGTADEMQIFRMLKYAERNIRSVVTRGRGGRLYYSSCWRPEKYSTCGLFPAENACLALAYYRNGQPEKGFEILEALADAFDLSPYPGSLTHVLSAQGGTDDGDIDFTDVSSCYLRLLIEGLWGVRIDRLSGRHRFAPQLPDAWTDASIDLPDAAVCLHREDAAETLTVFCGAPGEVELRLPMTRAEVEQITVDGVNAGFSVERGFGRSFAVVKFPSGRHVARVFYAPAPTPRLKHPAMTVFPGNRELVEVIGGTADELVLPPSMSAVGADGFRVETTARPGKYDLFVRSGAVILPLEVTIPAPPPEPCFHPASGRQVRLDMSGMFNAALTEVHRQDFVSPRPAGYSIGVRKNGRYAWEWNHYGHNALHVDDSLLRRCGGRFPAPGNWEFLTPETGNNVCCVSQWDNFPSAAELPVSGRVRQVAVLFCGTTNAMQSKVVNATIEAVYADGRCEKLELIPPDNFADFLHPVYQAELPTVPLGEGTVGSVAVLTAAPGRELEKIRFAAVANEVILMVMGVTVTMREE